MSQALLLRVIALEAALAALSARVAALEVPASVAQVRAVDLAGLPEPCPDEIEMLSMYRIQHAGFGRWLVVDRNGKHMTGHVRKEEAERLAAEFKDNAALLAARSVA